MGDVCGAAGVGARVAGIPVSHLDCHMGAVFLRPDFFACYVRLGRELGVPVLAAVSTELREAVEQAGVHCTAWRELRARRHAV